MENQKSVNFKTVMMMAGAFTSFTVGAGFASGNEVLQFFGSWGFPASILSVIGAAIITGVYCVGLYRAGQYVQFEKTSDCYTFFGGPILGRFFNLYVFVNIFGVFMLMFTGAGSLLNQFWGIPQIVGAAIMGIVSGIVVLGGLKVVENVLGSMGIVILAYIIIFGIVSLFNPASSFDQAAGADQAVASGQIWQANLFNLPPLSWVPGLSGMNSALVEGILYGAICIVSGFPFMVILGRSTRNKLEATAAGIVSSIVFYGCVAFVLIILLSNFNALVDPATNKMYDFPTLAAVDSIWPAGSWTFALIVFIAIFTTISGYLWVLRDMFFPGQQERTRKIVLFTLILIIFGITLGGVLPFSVIINFLFPISGIVGFIMTISVVVKLIKGFDGYKSKKGEPTNLENDAEK